MDEWALLLLVIMVFGGGDEFQSLIQSDTFDAAFDKTISNVKETPAEEIKEQLIKHFEEHKETVRTMNTYYHQNKTVK